MLTGESASIEKKDGDVVLAATTVLAGEGTARVIAIADNHGAARLGRFKCYVIVHSVLRRFGAQFTSLTYGAIVLSLLIAIVYYFSWR